MHIDVAFTAASATGSQMSQRTVCIIDVLRASSTITAALAAGADAVWPEETIEAATQRKEELVKQGLPVVLAGERNAFPPPGFDLGNSPGEFTPQRVGGKQVVLTTTNGTLALVRAVAAGAHRIYVAAFVNNQAIVEQLLQDWETGTLGDGILLLAAGSEGRVSLEDTVCAGMIAQRLSAQRSDIALTDAARVAVQAYAGAGASWIQLLQRGDHAQNLLSKGFKADVDWCLSTDKLSAIGYWHDDRLRPLST